MFGKGGGEQGFGLLEVILALAVLEIALLPIINLTSQANYCVKKARWMTEAVNLARRQLEIERGKDFNQIVAVGKSNLSGANYNSWIEVNQISPRLKQVTVKVKREGVLKAKLTTIVVKKGD